MSQESQGPNGYPPLNTILLKKSFNGCIPRDVGWSMVKTTQDQVANGYNARRKLGKVPSAAIVIVHAGFIESSLRDYQEILATRVPSQRLKSIYGFNNKRDLYDQDHLPDTHAARQMALQKRQLARHTQSMMSLVGGSPELPVVHYIDMDFFARVNSHRDIHRREIPHDLLPQPDSFVISTMRTSSEPTIHVPLGPGDVFVRQSPGGFFAVLKDAGVSTLFMAGELAHLPGKIGCLGSAAIRLMNDFTVQGIDTAVYPNQPPANFWQVGDTARYTDAHRTLFDQLYLHQMPLGELVAVTP